MFEDLVKGIAQEVQVEAEQYSCGSAAYALQDRLLMRAEEDLKRKLVQIEQITLVLETLEMSGVIINTEMLRLLNELSHKITDELSEIADNRPLVLYTTSLDMPETGGVSPKSGVGFAHKVKSKRVYFIRVPKADYECTADGLIAETEENRFQKSSLRAKAAHEIGHIVVDEFISSNADREKNSNTFAEELLRVRNSNIRTTYPCEG